MDIVSSQSPVGFCWSTHCVVGFMRTELRQVISTIGLAINCVKYNSNETLTLLVSMSCRGFKPVETVNSTISSLINLIHELHVMFVSVSLTMTYETP